MTASHYCLGLYIHLQYTRIYNLDDSQFATELIIKVIVLPLRYFKGFRNFAARMD